MESQRNIIELNLKIYKRATNSNRDIFDEQEAKIAAEQVLREAEILLKLSQKALNNDNLINNIPDSKTKFQEYQNFTREIINKF